jgi:hypothetical protein
VECIDLVREVSASRSVPAFSLYIRSPACFALFFHSRFVSQNMIAHIRYVSMNQSEVLSDDSKVIRVYISLPTYLPTHMYHFLTLNFLLPYPPCLILTGDTRTSSPGKCASV